MHFPNLIKPCIQIRWDLLGKQREKKRTVVELCALPVVVRFRKSIQKSIYNCVMCICTELHVHDCPRAES